MYTLFFRYCLWINQHIKAWLLPIDFFFCFKNRRKRKSPLKIDICWQVKLVCEPVFIPSVLFNSQAYLHHGTRLSSCQQDLFPKRGVFPLFLCLLWKSAVLAHILARFLISGKAALKQPWCWCMKMCYLLSPNYLLFTLLLRTINLSLSIGLGAEIFMW